MNADEVVNRLRKYAKRCDGVHSCWNAPTLLAAADLIESLQAQLAASQCRAQDARNELCMKCGRYHEAHKGVCDGCRWKEN